MPLRIRRADVAPGLSRDEFYGRIPESVISDRDCSPGAKALYGAITLAMALEQNPKICLATMQDLADLIGLEIRQTRRLVAELERRGHVVRERVRTISGSPQGIRPTARLRGQRTRSDLTDCNRSSLTAQPDTLDRAPGQIRPGARSGLTASLKEEKQRERKQQQNARDSVPVVVAFSSSTGGEETMPAEPTDPAEVPAATDRPAFLASLVLDLADALAIDPGPPTTPGAQKSPVGPSTKTTPRGQSRQSVPDPHHPTNSPHTPSRRADENEHNRD